MRTARKALLLAITAASAAVPIALASGDASGDTTSPPTVSTAAATNVTGSGATLNGSVNPNGQQTSYAFQWGPTNGYGNETSLSSAGSGTSAGSVSAALSGLASGTTYHYRIIAINSAGTATGADHTLTTTGTAPAPSASPTATTGAVSSVTQSTADVNGTVNPKGQATSYHFEYGSSPDYGFESASVNAGSGTTEVNASTQLANLQPGTTYHYRLVADSPGGVALGADRTLTTSTSGAGTSHVAFMGRMGFVSPGRVIGVEAGCFGGQTRCTGHVTMSHEGAVIGQRNFDITPESGGFQNMKLTQTGARLLRHNRVHRLLAVDVAIDTSEGQHIHQTMHLARWVWR